MEREGRSEIDRDTLFLPVAETGWLGAARAAMLGRALTRREIDGATFGRFDQGAAGGLADGALARGMRHVFVEDGRIDRLVVVVVMVWPVVMATATGRGGMFGHRLTVLRAKGLQPK